MNAFNSRCLFLKNDLIRYISSGFPVVILVSCSIHLENTLTSLYFWGLLKLLDFHILDWKYRTVLIFLLQKRPVMSTVVQGLASFNISRKDLTFHLKNTYEMIANSETTLVVHLHKLFFMIRSDPFALVWKC